MMELEEYMKGKEVVAWLSGCLYGVISFTLIVVVYALIKRRKSR